LQYLKQRVVEMSEEALMRREEVKIDFYLAHSLITCSRVTRMGEFFAQRAIVYYAQFL
jgi:hypothetical protein